MNKIYENKIGNVLYYDFFAEGKEALLAEMGGFLIQQGKAKEGYVEGIIEREKVFPTGLPTKGVGIAIPHTDSVHVIEAAVLVGNIEKDIPFEVMGSKCEYVDVGLVFMLAIKEPDKQLLTLQKLVALCQDEGSLKILKEKTNEKQIAEILGSLV